MFEVEIKARVLGKSEYWLGGLLVFQKKKKQGEHKGREL
jgi:hypothetical protein